MIYRFPPYVPWIAVAVAAVAFLAGFWVLRKRLSWRVAAVPFMIALLAGGIVAPMLAMDRVVVDDEKIEQTTGFWFAPTVKGFRYVDIVSVRIVIGSDIKGRPEELWIVEGRDGTNREIDPGDLWEWHGHEIALALQNKGIPVRR